MRQKVIALLFMMIVLPFCTPKKKQTESPSQKKTTVTEGQGMERRLLGLFLYIEGDYAGAVGDKGSILNEDEYKEMQEFSKTALQMTQGFQKTLNKEAYERIESRVQELHSCIAKKCAPKDVSLLTAALKQDVIGNFQIQTHPTHFPDFERGKKIYHRTCASCHGHAGKGDGIAAAALNPPPRSFQEEDILAEASPFKFYNTLVTGIEGTGMVSYNSILSEEEKWDVSFYLHTLFFQPESYSFDLKASQKAWDLYAEKYALPESLSFLSSSTNRDIQKWLLKAGVSKSLLKEATAFLRLHAPYAKKIPEAIYKSENYPWDFIHDRIDFAEASYLRKDYEEAHGQLLDAYLQGFEKVESTLAVIDRSLMAEIESRFSVARTYASRGHPQFLELLAPLKELVKEAEMKVKGTHTEDVWIFADFLSSFIIILREGFEAFLIIVALLMIVQNMHVPEAKKWIHAGWFSAVLFGFIAYFLFEHVLKISGAARETIEAFCTLLATVVLFYTGFWLISQTEHNKWQKYIKMKTNEAIGKSKLWILFGISFLAVFREAAETVLFYSALLAKSSQTSSVFLGFLAGIAVLFFVCFGIAKYQVRVPLKYFFKGTSTFMVLLSIVLAGKTVHELIAAGYLKATPVSFLPMVDILGIYPLKETFYAQCFLILLAIFFIFRTRFYKTIKN